MFKRNGTEHSRAHDGLFGREMFSSLSTVINDIRYVHTGQVMQQYAIPGRTWDDTDKWIGDLEISRKVQVKLIGRGGP
jgi:hypothetical protein